MDSSGASRGTGTFHSGMQTLLAGWTFQAGERFCQHLQMLHRLSPVVSRDQLSRLSVFPKEHITAKPT